MLGSHGYYMFWVIVDVPRSLLHGCLLLHRPEFAEKDVRGSIGFLHTSRSLYVIVSGYGQPSGHCMKIELQTQIRNRLPSIQYFLYADIAIP